MHNFGAKMEHSWIAIGAQLALPVWDANPLYLGWGVLQETVARVHVFLPN